MEHEVHPETLPPELWHSVASFLTPDSLRSWCLVSKGFRLLVQPELFQHYEQPSEPDECSLRPFMRVCLARPDLAAAVRKATVHEILPWDDDDETHQLARRKKRKTKTSHWKRKYDLELQHLRSEGWPPTTNSDDDQYMARDFALLCSLIPKVEHLILDLPPTPFTLLDSPLSQLRHLQVDFLFEKDGLELRDLRHLINLSSLKILQGHHVNCEDDIGDRSEDQRPLSMPGQLSIEHINLMCSAMTQSRIKELVEGCRTLKTFQLVYGEVLVGAIYECDFDKLSSVFLAHKASLESLTLDFENDTATEILEDEDITGVMAMSSFECLRHIDLPEWALLRAYQSDDGSGKSGSKSISTLLPRSLESLVIRSCDANTVPPLWGLLSDLDTFPNLKEIAFGGAPAANLEGLDGFEDACKDKGIGLNKEK